MAAAGTATDAESVAGADPGPVLALSEGQLATWVQDGFVIIEVEQELPQGFCDEFTNKAWRLRDSLGDGGLQQFDDEIQQLIRTPSCHGALLSLLGPGFTACTGADTMHSLVDRNQGWHQDDRRHPDHPDIRGPGDQATVRDHFPRHIMVSFYPATTNEDNGPTAVLPGSAFLEEASMLPRDADGNQAVLASTQAIPQIYRGSI